MICYDIVKDTDLGSFIDDVEHYLNDGYTLAGNLIAISRTQTNNNGETVNEILYIQSIVKPINAVNY